MPWFCSSSKLIDLLIKTLIVQPILPEPERTTEAERFLRPATRNQESGPAGARVRKSPEQQSASKEVIRKWPADRILESSLAGTRARKSPEHQSASK